MKVEHCAAMTDEAPSLTEPTGKRKTSEALSEPPRERKRLREDSEQLDEEEPGRSTLHGFVLSMLTSH